MTLHRVRNGRHILEFHGDVLAVASSERPGEPRWSELVIYGISQGCYVRSKIGYSLVAHRPECRRVTPVMSSWIDLEDAVESRADRVPCVECQPATGQGMDPHTVVEATRYSAVTARSAEHLAKLLLETPGNKTSDRPSRLVARVAEQLASKDPAFAAQWSLIASPAVALKRTG